MLDRRLATALHVAALRHPDLHPEDDPHVLFQASMIGALLDGAYEGDAISEDRPRGGHVLSRRPRRGRARLDPYELHVELPRGIELEGAELAGETREALRRAKRSG